ncbi:hypothetical protein [Lactobacillus delbrueckii]|uniref:hypothetical protein n=1 Tax=Lactobacillus delbrueckii TaxID=1584 RepID=UPI001F132472|nr:hypothetical protein [Lactobacillus delbrueckii]
MWNRFARFSFDKFIQNLTGYAATYNGEWWFIRAFIAAILLGTIYYYLTEKIHIVYVETGLVLFISVIIVKFLPALIKLDTFSSLASSYLWTQLFMPDTFVCAYLFGIVFGKYDILCKVMQFFGGLSTNMWLTHTFFCYYFYPFAIVVFWSRNPIVAYLTLLAITVFASVFLDKFYFSIEKLGVKLRKKIKGIKNR